MARASRLHSGRGLFRKGTLRSRTGSVVAWAPPDADTAYDTTRAWDDAVAVNSPVASALCGRPGPFREQLY